jgi:hypothetical protein
MKKLWQWLKAANENAKKRAEFVLAAKSLLANMDPNYCPEAGTSDGVALLLMRLGLVHLQAVYLGQMQSQNLIRAKNARLN